MKAKYLSLPMYLLVACSSQQAVSEEPVQQVESETKTTEMTNVSAETTDSEEADENTPIVQDESSPERDKMIAEDTTRIEETVTPSENKELSKETTALQTNEEVQQTVSVNEAELKPTATAETFCTILSDEDKADFEQWVRQKYLDKLSLSRLLKHTNKKVEYTHGERPQKKTSHVSFLKSTYTPLKRALLAAKESRARTSSVVVSGDSTLYSGEIYEPYRVSCPNTTSGTSLPLIEWSIESADNSHYGVGVTQDNSSAHTLLTFVKLNHGYRMISARIQ